MSTDRDLFDKIRLPPDLDTFLRSTNPWWEGKPGRVLPSYRRWAFDVLLRKLETGMAPAVVIRGARQVGKTTLQEQAIEHLQRAQRVAPKRIGPHRFSPFGSGSPIAYTGTRPSPGVVYTYPSVASGRVRV